MTTPMTVNDRKNGYFGLDDLAKVGGGWKLPFGPNSFTPFWPKMAQFGPKWGSKKAKTLAKKHVCMGFMY